MTMEDRGQTEACRSPTGLQEKGYVLVPLHRAVGVHKTSINREGPLSRLHEGASSAGFP